MFSVDFDAGNVLSHQLAVNIMGLINMLGVLFVCFHL